MPSSARGFCGQRVQPRKSGSRWRGASELCSDCHRPMSGKAVGRCSRGSMAQESEQEETTAKGTEQACAIPYGKALVEVANEHFGFVTAESEVQQPHGAVPPLEDRLRMLEENLEAMRGSLAAIAGEARGGSCAVPLPAKPSPKPAPAPKDLPGMDPTTVRAALQAGIPAHHLERS